MKILDAMFICHSENSANEIESPDQIIFQFHEHRNSIDVVLAGGRRYFYSKGMIDLHMLHKICTNFFRSSEANVRYF